MLIQKRDGRKKEFDVKRIFNAVLQAAKSVEDISDYEAHNIATEVADKVVGKVKADDSVDSIQEKVERQLMLSKWKNVATAYVEFRHDRDRVRKEKDTYAKIGIDITSGEDTESQRENSNVARGTVTTQLEMIKRNYARKFANDFILPEKFKQLHEKGVLHIHDSDSLITKLPNCILMDYPYMFKNGFQLGNKWIEEPNTILTAMNILVQMVQVQATLEFGGITLPDVDVHLGKYVLGSYKNHLLDAVMDLQDVDEDTAKCQLEDMVPVHPDNDIIKTHLERENKVAVRKTEREVYRACKLLSYQMNTLQVRGESSPFTTIGYGNSTTWEGRLIQQKILEERWDEFHRSGVQEFPKHMMAVRKGINYFETDPNYDLFKLANKVSALSAYPDYIFPENQETHTGGSAFYMG